jgi:hypothetical protein
MTVIFGNAAVSNDGKVKAPANFSAGWSIVMVRVVASSMPRTARRLGTRTSAQPKAAALRRSARGLAIPTRNCSFRRKNRLDLTSAGSRSLTAILFDPTAVLVAGQRGNDTVFEERQEHDGKQHAAYRPLYNPGLSGLPCTQALALPQWRCL